MYSSQFSPRSQFLMLLACEEAARLQDDYVGSEHVFLGLLSVEEDAGVRFLHQAGLDLESVRAHFKKEVRLREMHAENAAGTRNACLISDDHQRVVALAEVAAGSFVEMDRIPHAITAQKIFNRALQEAEASQHDCVRPEHILLALLQEEDGLPARILKERGIDPKQIRKQVMRSWQPEQPPCGDGSWRFLL